MTMERCLSAWIQGDREVQGWLVANQGARSCPRVAGLDFWAARGACPVTSLGTAAANPQIKQMRDPHAEKLLTVWTKTLKQDWKRSLRKHRWHPVGGRSPQSSRLYTGSWNTRASGCCLMTPKCVCSRRMSSCELALPKHVPHQHLTCCFTGGCLKLDASVNSRTTVNSGRCASQAFWQLSTQTVSFCNSTDGGKNAVLPELKLGLSKAGATVRPRLSPCTSNLFRAVYYKYFLSCKDE